MNAKTLFLFGCAFCAVAMDMATARNWNEEDWEEVAEVGNIYTLEQAARAGNAEAQFHLATLYYYGRRVSQDYTKAAEWYAKAAAQGDSLAETMLDTMRREGKTVKVNGKSPASVHGNNIPQNLAELYKSAACGDAAAQYELGNMYYVGHEVSQDYTKAAEWLGKAAEQGDMRAARLADFIYSARLEDAREYRLAVMKSNKQFSSDPAPDTARLLLSQLWRVKRHLAYSNKADADEVLSLSEVRKKLELYNTLKESVMLLGDKIDEMALNAELEASEVASLAKNVRDFKAELRTDRTIYVSDCFIKPYLHEALVRIEKADKLIGHDKVQLRQAVYLLSNCAASKVLYTATERTRIEFIEVLAKAKAMAGKAEWEELRQYTKLLDSLDMNLCKGGEAWLP